MLKSFKEFLARGNVLDLAVAFILGVAFGRVVTSFVNDILMPPIGMLLGKMDFSNLYVNLGPGEYESLAAARAAGAPVIAYGSFINALVDFIIIAFALFLIIRAAMRANLTTAPPMKNCPFCLQKIPEQATRCPVLHGGTDGRDEDGLISVSRSIRKAVEIIGE